MASDSWLTQVFLSEVEVQCSFALMARADIEVAIEQVLHKQLDASFDTLRVWYSVQAFLSACANVSKLLWPKSNPGTGESKDEVRRRRERGARLRHVLGISDGSSLSCLRDKRLRNYFEHFDERLDKWAESSPNHILMTRCSGTPGSFVIPGMVPGDTMGYLNLSSREVTFQDLVISLPQMFAAVEDLYRRIHVTSPS